MSFSFFFFNDTATTEIYPLSLHDALPISGSGNFGRKNSPALFRHGWNLQRRRGERRASRFARLLSLNLKARFWRSEEHTSELQSLTNLVCRLLLAKKKREALYDAHDIVPS